MELQILVLIGLFIILVLLNINTRKLLGGDNHDDDDYVNLDNTDTDTDTDTASGNKKGLCSLEEIKKHNNSNDKWIYNNGVIYNLNTLIKKKYVPQIAVSLVQENFNSLITLFEKTDLQDFSKISKSMKHYNEFIDTSSLENTSVFAGSEEQFNDFINTFLSIINISEIKQDIICPAGLTL